MRTKLKLLLCFSILSYILNAQTPQNDQNWNSTPFFSDGFDSWDALKWRTQFSWGPYPPGADLIYLPSQTSVSGSKLILKAENHSDSNYPLVNYKMGMVESFKTDFKYGYFEIECKLNSSGNAFNLSFWLYDANNCVCPNGCIGGWYNEIDFFEYLSDDSNLSSNLHVKNNSCTDWAPFEDYFTAGITPGLTSDFHVYGYEWTPNKLIFYLDGKPYRYLYDSRVPNNPLKLLIQMADRYTTNSLTIPSYMEIKQVNVYSLKMSNCSDEVITNFNSSTYNNYSVKKTITINGTSNTLSGANVTLRAQDGIVVNGDFTVQAGAEFILLPTGCY